MIRIGSLAAALLLLAGCWIGTDLYRQQDARAVLPAGDYRLKGDVPGMIDSGTVRIMIQADGTTQALPVSDNGTVDAGDAFAFGLAPFADDARLAAIWVTAMEGQPLSSDARLYGLLRRNDDGSHSLFFPKCEGESATAARRAGAEVVGDACRFTTRSQLEAALREMAPRLSEGFTLTPLLPPPSR